MNRKLGVKSVNILKVVIFEHADLHGVVLLPSLGILLYFLLVSLTFDPLTPGSINITAGHPHYLTLPLLLQLNHDGLTGSGRHRFPDVDLSKMIYNWGMIC